MMRSIITALCLVGVIGGVAHADEYKRLTSTVNAPYLLVPVYEVNVELALRPNFSVSVRGGGGATDYFDVKSDIWEAGVQGTYYVWGNANRGVQVGLDARYVSYENEVRVRRVGRGHAHRAVVVALDRRVALPAGLPQTIAEQHGSAGCEGSVVGDRQIAADALPPLESCSIPACSRARELGRGCA